MTLTWTSPARAVESILIGQSLPLSGPGYTAASRVLAGAKAQVARTNAAGGIGGRPIELVTLDDAGDLRQHAANLRSLVRDRRAVAIVNCLGEQACGVAAQVTRELGVSLLGPMAGTPALRSVDARHVFSVRPPDAKEADALAGQLLSIGISSAALLSDAAEPERAKTLLKALQQRGLQVTSIQTEPHVASLDAAFRAVADAKVQALVFNVGANTVESLGQRPIALVEGGPKVIATLSSAGLTQFIRLFRDKLVGYTQVVPDPESQRLSISRDLQSDADAFVGPEALTFEGMEAYIHLHICVEALRRAGPRVDATRLQDVLANFGVWDVAGFRVQFGREVRYASDFLDIGLRSRDGRLLR